MIKDPVEKTMKKINQVCAGGGSAGPGADAGGGGCAGCGGGSSGSDGGGGGGFGGGFGGRGRGDSNPGQTGGMSSGSAPGGGSFGGSEAPGPEGGGGFGGGGEAPDTGFDPFNEFDDFSMNVPNTPADTAARDAEAEARERKSTRNAAFRNARIAATVTNFITANPALAAMAAMATFAGTQMAANGISSEANGGPTGPGPGAERTEKPKIVEEAPVDITPEIGLGMEDVIADLFDFNTGADLFRSNIRKRINALSNRRFQLSGAPSIYAPRLS